MATFDFPASPNNNDTYSLNGVTYKYVAAKQRWEIVPTPHNFETTAQLDIRDTANRSRSNHTGAQAASTISDFDTEVSNNIDVAANTSARHDAVTVVDSSEIDFTLTGQQITASIVAGSIDESKLDASVNASLDLADSSVQLTGDQSIAGTKTFTTALILPNNSRINGVEHFYQSGPTAPTTRGDGSALIAGDRWWKTDDGTEWFWNGTYWVDPVPSWVPWAYVVFDGSQVRTHLSSIGGSFYAGRPFLIGPMFFYYKTESGGTFDSSNYHRVSSPTVRLLDPNYAGDISVEARTDPAWSVRRITAIKGPPLPVPTTNWQFYKTTANPEIVNDVLNFQFLTPNPTVIGTPGDLKLVSTVEIRRIFVEL